MTHTASGGAPIFGVPQLAVLCPTSTRRLNPERWRQIRRTTLGGHSVVALFHAHVRHGPVDVWLDMRGDVRAQDIDGNERTRGGDLLEPVVSGWFANGGDQWKRPGGPYTTLASPILVRTDRAWHRASPDRMVLTDGKGVDVSEDQVMASMLHLKPDAGAEVKTHGFLGGGAYAGFLDEDEDDNVTSPEESRFATLPDDKRIQSSWYQSALETEWWFVVVLIDTHLQRTWVIRRDLEAEAYLLEEAERFMRVNVVGGAEPRPDGSSSFSRYLSRRFERNRPELLPATAEANEMALEYRAAIAERKAAQKREAAAKQALQVYIGDAGGVMTTSGKIGWNFRRSGKLRDKDLRAELYKRLDYDDGTISRLEAEYALPDFRAISHPQWK